MGKQISWRHRHADPNEIIVSILGSENLIDMRYTHGDIDLPSLLFMGRGRLLLMEKRGDVFSKKTIKNNNVLGFDVDF